MNHSPGRRGRDRNQQILIYKLPAIVAQVGDKGRREVTQVEDRDRGRWTSRESATRIMDWLGRNKLHLSHDSGVAARPS